MPLNTGDRLGPYEVTALIGSGGMGEVSRARDTKLGRDVASKSSRTSLLMILNAWPGSNVKPESSPR